MADVDLTPIDLELLPPIAHASAEGDPPPHPETFKAVSNLEHLIRPEHGLWCSPVTAWSAEGAPTATAWTEWCATPDELTGLPSENNGRYTQFTEVVAAPGLPADHPVSYFWRDAGAGGTRAGDT
jgi:hypothetical protein